MFEKYNHDLDLHFVASSLIRYPVSVSIAVQHACAAELYVMMCGIRSTQRKSCPLYFLASPGCCSSAHLMLSPWMIILLVCAR